MLHGIHLAYNRPSTHCTRTPRSSLTVSTLAILRRLSESENGRPVVEETAILPFIPISMDTVPKGRCSLARLGGFLSLLMCSGKSKSSLGIVGFVKVMLSETSIGTPASSSKPQDELGTAPLPERPVLSKRAPSLACWGLMLLFFCGSLLFLRCWLS